MEAYLFFAGEISDYEQIKNLIKYKKNIFCADGGANHLLTLDLEPQLLLGDFDSISEEAKVKFENCKKLVFSSDKDYSDGELLIKEVYDKYEKIYILGGFGGRLDHSYFNLHLMEKYPKCVLINHDEEVFLLNEETIFKSKNNKRISFLPLDKENIINLEGFLYNLYKKEVNRGECLTLSNVITKDIATVSISKGSFLCSIQI